jgi:hypothetical protein
VNTSNQFDGFFYKSNFRIIMGLGNFLRAQLLRKFLPIGSFGMAPAVLKEKKDDSSPESSQGSAASVAKFYIILKQIIFRIT